MNKDIKRRRCRKGKGTEDVNGGAVFIGAHTCKALPKSGYTPVAFDNLCYGHRSAVEWVPLKEGDIAISKESVIVKSESRSNYCIHP